MGKRIEAETNRDNCWQSVYRYICEIVHDCVYYLYLQLTDLI